MFGDRIKQGKQIVFDSKSLYWTHIYPFVDTLH